MPINSTPILQLVTDSSVRNCFIKSDAIPHDVLVIDIKQASGSREAGDCWAVQEIE